MKIPRKDLTKEQKNEICKKYYDEHSYTWNCKKCPLLKLHRGLFGYCYKTIDELEEFINEYWNEEVKIKE